MKFVGETEGVRKLAGVGDALAGQETFAKLTLLGRSPRVRVPGLFRFRVVHGTGGFTVLGHGVTVGPITRVSRNAAPTSPSAPEMTGAGFHPVGAIHALRATVMAGADSAPLERAGTW